MVVLDASGSMATSSREAGWPSRIAEARVALGIVLPAVEPVRRIGMVSYGLSATASPCDGITVEARPAPFAADALLEIAEALRPGGRTPLMAAVAEAAEALGPRGTVVLVTDGEETCGGRPCALGASLAARAPGVTVHVIGFRLGPVQPPPGHERGGPGANARPADAGCLAEATGGMRARADTLEELVEALRRTLGCALLF